MRLRSFFKAKILNFENSESARIIEIGCVTHELSVEELETPKTLRTGIE
jgi:hypothetical protein